MRYKLRLSRTTEVLSVVEIPADLFIKSGDIVMVDGNYHEIKLIIRPAILEKNIDLSAGGLKKEKFEEAMPILVIGDSFPLI